MSGPTCYGPRAVALKLELGGGPPQGPKVLLSTFSYSERLLSYDYLSLFFVESDGNTGNPRNKHDPKESMLPTTQGRR